MNNLVVVGGGTAGWITALYTKKMLPNHRVTLIQSPEIGIIGVGEGSTAIFVRFLEMIGITGDEFFEQTSGTIKNGINFENWHGDGTRYFHAFGDKLRSFSLNPTFGNDAESFFYKNLIANNLSFEDYRYQTYLSYQNKVDLVNTAYALHFDAAKLADLLKSKAKLYGISVIDGNVINVTQDERGFISKIHLNDRDEAIDADFVFDCSGFSRLLVGGIFKQRWISCGEYLPLKKAIPFWFEHTTDIKPYTTSTAMPHGWTWEIPLQHRIGAGYVFDSDRISVDQALQEAEQLFKRKLEIRKVIDFSPGRYENYWVKNCLAIGLSSSFLEPLEATSIALTIGQLGIFRFFYNQLDSCEEPSVKLFNEMMATSFDETLSFIYLHYITQRSDTDFWKNFRRDTKMPDRVAEFLELASAGVLVPFDFPRDNRTAIGYPISSYLEVGHGLRLIKSKITNQEFINPSPAEYRNIIQSAGDRAMSHNSLLAPYLDKQK
jgi:tryptophan halogenase